MKRHAHQSVQERRQELSSEIGVPLSHIGAFSINESIASTRHCENMIGVAQVPLGVAGPLVVNGQSVYVPLATTEGALVASVNRGSKAITESGGCRSFVKRVGVTRGPVFSVSGHEEGARLEMFLQNEFDALRAVAQQTSSHICLLSYDTSEAGQYWFVRFRFDTQEAMGLNMVTIATDAIVSYITRQTGIRCISLSGNYCVDKKPSWANAILGRGRTVVSEVTVPAHVLTRVLKTTADALYETWLAKCMIGSAVTGSMGYNAQYANVLAALFIATGQDPAHVGEGSVGMTVVSKAGDGIVISVTMPDVMVGVVGGGTELETARESLALMGISQSSTGEQTDRFAAIVGASVLAGEISLLSSLSVGTLAQSHEKLARGGTHL